MPRQRGAVGISGAEEIWERFHRQYLEKQSGITNPPPTDNNKSRKKRSPSWVSQSLICPWCKIPFSQRRPNQKYCSNKCTCAAHHQRWYRQRRKLSPGTKYRLVKDKAGRIITRLKNTGTVADWRE